MLVDDALGVRIVALLVAARRRATCRADDGQRIGADVRVPILVLVSVSVLGIVGVGVGLGIELLVDCRRVAERGVVRLLVLEPGDRLLSLTGGSGRVSEGRHLDGLPAEEHVCQPEASADQPAVAEQPPDLFRQRVGRDVEILRFQAQHEVADAAADQEGLVPRSFRR